MVTWSQALAGEGKWRVVEGCYMDLPLQGYRELPLRAMTCAKGTSVILM